mgnify:CR=1 FL=1
MIISKTPLRISFAGGGSDIGWFYEKFGGAVVSIAISKYIYITLNKKFDSKIRASYSQTEIVDRVDDLKHELIRESLKMAKIDGGIEITSISDIPSKGTGLGSSSSYTVGLLNALYAYKNRFVSAEKLARSACKVEIDVLDKPIGRQDQYIASYGGLRYFEFNPDSTVSTELIICKPETKKRLEESLLMLYTGLTRSSGLILKNQEESVSLDEKKIQMMVQMVEIARQMKEKLEKNNLKSFGELLHENWLLKRNLGDGITNTRIDEWYRIARSKGAIGGKITGAGGGGFLLLYAPKHTHSKIIRALADLKPLQFSLEPEGSKIIFVGG